MSSTVDADIRRHRAADVTLTLHRADGSPLANADVVVEQVGHAFLFGGNGHGGIALANDELDGEAAAARAEDLQAKLLDLFNFVTLPFYWKWFEPRRGNPETCRLLKAARWFIDRGCAVKGHPLCWHTLTADWLLEMSDEQIVEAQLARIRRDVTDFAGAIDAWDVINEVVIMPIFEKYDNGVSRMCRRLGRIGIIRETFAAARAANPRATLLLNDFDMSAAFECLIEGCLEAGIRIDAIGLQSHMHQGWWGVEKTQRILERFARYELPLHFTETNIISGQLMPPHIEDLNDYQVEEWPTTPEGEARQADEVVRHYKTLLAHPAVKAITWWDFIDGGWLKAPAGLVRADRSLKPAYAALHKLVKGEWWLRPTKLRTDGDAAVRFHGFFGQYRLTYQGRQVGFDVAEGGGSPALTLRL
jgi:GH35 family endo-1,4-beta-xylanase